MVSTAAGTTVDLDEAAQAEELRPRFGEYPTERVYYDTLVMLAMEANPNVQPFQQPLSLEQIANEGIGLGKPAVGALATYSQSWFAQGITLGQMLHSLALAPGEATRIAVANFARQTRATVTETVAGWSNSIMRWTTLGLRARCRTATRRTGCNAAFQ